MATPIPYPEIFFRKNFQDTRLANHINNASYQMNLRKRFLKGGAVYRADLRIFFGMVVSMASCIMERV